MDTRKYLLILFLLTLLSPMGWAQKTNSITLTARSSSLYDLSATTIAGDHRATIVDNTQWLNYSIRDNSGILYTLQASIVSSTIPPGMEIHLELGPYYGTGQGGQTTGSKLLSNIPTVLISNMPQGVTGIGQLCGHNVILSVGITNFALLHPGNYPLTIQYTFVAQ